MSWLRRLGRLIEGVDVFGVELFIKLCNYT